MPVITVKEILLWNERDKKETWKLNVTCDSGLDPFDIKDIIGTTGKTWMRPKDY